MTLVQYKPKLYVAKATLPDVTPIRHQFGSWMMHNGIYRYAMGLTFDRDVEFLGMKLLADHMHWVPRQLVRGRKAVWHIEMWNGKIACRQDLRIRERLEFQLNQYFCTKQEFYGVKVCQSCIKHIRDDIPAPKDSVGRATHLNFCPLPEMTPNMKNLINDDLPMIVFIQNTIDGQFCRLCYPKHLDSSHYPPVPQTHGGGQPAAGNQPLQAIGHIEEC